MPSSTTRLLGWPRGAVQGVAFPPSYRPDDVLIAPWSTQALGNEINALISPVTATWSNQSYPAASRVVAFPFQLGDYFLVRKVWALNATTATTDSRDIGVYDEAGTTLLVSGGSHAIATANVVQERDCTDTLLAPGRYWCAYIQGGTTATVYGLNFGGTNSRCIGNAQQAGSGSTLGSTFTPAALSAGVFPAFGIASRTLVA